MNILTKLTKRNLKLNKKRTIGTIIGIVLSVALICAVSGMFTSIQETLIKNAINERGYFHIAFETINQEELNKYKLNNDIEDINAVYELGESHYINSNKDEPYITVYSTEKQDFDNLSYTLVDGKFPTNSNEIVISKKMSIYSKLKVGDYIELNIGQRKTKDGYSLNKYNTYQGEENEYIDNPTYKKYKIVGIAYRERNSNGVYGITTGVINDEVHAYISLKNPKDYKQSFIELLNVDSYDKIKFSDTPHIDFEYTINSELLRWQVFAFSDSTISMFSAIAIVVIAIIIIVSVFCIRNSFAISTTEKMKMYGMLASVGATRKQIKKSVILEGIILGLIGIPLGILCGIIAVFIFFSSITMESEIKERDMILISEETITYELVSLRTDKEIVGHGSRYYLHIYENRVFDFYYKSTKNGIEGFEPGTIVADDVFIAQTVECPPVIIETIRTYDYSFTPFERFWFSETTTFEPITHKSYDIYVPEGSILGSYELE